VRHTPLGKALKQYADSRHKQALIKLLSPVNQAGKKCPWVAEQVTSGKIYQSQAWTAQQAYTLLNSVNDLEDSALTVRVPDWWKKRIRPQVSVTIGSKKNAYINAAALLDFDAQIALGDQKLSKQELDELLNGEDGLVFVKE